MEEGRPNLQSGIEISVRTFAIERAHFSGGGRVQRGRHCRGRREARAPDTGVDFPSFGQNQDRTLAEV
eukprot:3947253-Lingulodinium_polyedra.AAC.1